MIEIVVDTAIKINDNNIPNTKIKLYLRQLLTALGPLMGISVTGISNGYSASLLPQLKSISSNDSESLFESANADHFEVLSIDQESWIAAILSVTPECWTGGFMAEKLGKRHQ